MTTRPLISKLEPANRRSLSIYLGRVVAAAMLVVLFPAMALIGIAVWLDNPGPVFFRQVRSGLDGEIYLIHKFRTMRFGADGHAHVNQTTGVGRILRRFGVDELPQLLNIVRGEMSFVGPRPTLPEQVIRYGDRERRRLEVRPGITGWAQVNGRNAIDWQTRIDLDIWYIDHQSMALDVRILLKTIPAALSGEGVYGEEGRNPDYQQPSPPARARAA